MSVAGVIVTHGPDRDLPRALAALEPQVEELVVVANPPPPETSASLIVNEEPLGFAANVNKGVAATRAEYVVVANPDTEPADEAVQRLVEFADSHPRAGIVGPQLVFPNGSPQSSRRRFPTVSGTIVRRTPLRKVLGGTQRRHYGLDEEPSQPVQADWLLGAFMLLRRDMLDELGGFDEGYRLYGEDIDIAYRAAQAGWERWYVPSALVRHDHRAITDTTFLTRRTLWHWRGILRFARKHPKQLIPETVRSRARSVLKPPRGPAAQLPEGVTERDLREFVESVRVSEGDPDELARYARGHFWRFVRTWNLVRDLEGQALELGANPYFTTMLLRELTDLDLTLANYFGSAGETEQEVVYRDGKTTLTSKLFDVERDRFPFEDDSFDVVLFCELIEHLTTDPVAALREIKRVLKPDGVLVLTTPNATRLENVERIVRGENVFDPYSAHGALGRHNREYTKGELDELVTYLGFDVEYLEAADTQEQAAGRGLGWGRIARLVRGRAEDLGQYLFLRARNARPAGERRPSFLYQSYPAGEVERT